MADIRNCNGRPAICIDGKFYPPMMATIRANNVDSVVLDRAYYRALGEAGIRIFFVICDITWLKPNALELFREEAEAILEEVPDAYLIPRMGLHPNNDWILAHPDECCTYSDGSKPGVKRFFTESYVTDMPRLYSLCSKVWRHDAGEALAETWRTLMTLPYADRIIGCFLAAGGTSEWYYKLPVLSGDMTLGHSPAFKRWFSEFLTEKYGCDSALQAAWKMPRATLADPPIPEAKKHYFASDVDRDCTVPPYPVLSNGDVPVPPPNEYSVGSFVDVDNNQQAHDFYLAWHNGTASSINEFARIIKSITPDKLVGAFYGAHGCTSFLAGGTCGGTLRILNSGLVDFLAAPGVYENRQPGGMEGQREFPDSFALRNMVYIVEQDTRTHMENAYFQDKYNAFDLTDSINIMKREFGRNLCEDTQAWWFDQLLGGRRYKHPALYSLIARQQQIAAEGYALPRKKPSEIAFIFDEESTQVVSQSTTQQCVEMLRNYEIARIGAPVDQYYHNDMANPAMPDYKLYLFVNVFSLTDSERAAIKAKLRRNHAVAVFLYASGLINPDREIRLSPDHISELTGFDMVMDMTRHSPKFRIGSHAAVSGMQPRFIYGWFDRHRMDSLGANAEIKSYLWPTFYPRDGERAATFLTFDESAVAVKEADGFTSVFYGAKLIRSDAIRSFAAFAGCHIWCDSDDVTYIGAQYITIHASTNGPKALHFPRQVTLTEVYDNTVYERVTDITVNMYLGETKMFRMISQ
ncbi:MAG: hypothetical protein IKS52_07580 [Clostridia bacterium]|nr:hypothetical protein [Clostridia bacterium]